MENTNTVVTEAIENLDKIKEYLETIDTETTGLFNTENEEVAMGYLRKIKNICRFIEFEKEYKEDARI